MSPSHNAYQAYAQANHTVSKTRQIVMLYDGAINFIRQGQEAIEDNRIEDRFNLLLKASEIVMGLQGCLDFESGDKIARVLYDFYSSVDSRLMAIQRSNDSAACTPIIEELKEMRDTWAAIDKGDINDETATPDAMPSAEQQPLASPAPTEQPLANNFTA